MDDYDEMNKLYSEIFPAVMTISSNSCDTFASDIEGIISNVNSATTVNWSDSAAQAFEENKKSVIDTLNKIYASITSVFKGAEGVYKTLSEQLHNYMNAYGVYQQHLANKPIRDDFEYPVYEKGTNIVSYYAVKSKYYTLLANWRDKKRKIEQAGKDMVENIRTYVSILEQIDNAGLDGANISFSNLASIIPASILPEITPLQMELYGNQTYGGAQGVPYNDFLAGDNTYVDIIRNYFPDLTDDEILPYLDKMKNTGCGFVATANYIFQAYKGREEQYERDFGFPMYYEKENGEISPSVNYLFTDIFSYAFKNNLVGYYKGEVNVSGIIDQANGMVPTEIPDILNSDRYKGANVDFIEIEDWQGKTANIRDYDNAIRDALTRGNAVNFDATNYKLIRVDRNNNPLTWEIGTVQGNAGHAMTITGITEDGNYIVSSEGMKYVLDSSTVDGKFGLYEVSFNDSLEQAQVATQGGSLNIRSGPGTDSSVINSVSNGATVDIVDYDGEWARVRLPDHNGYGYVNTQYLNKTNDV